MTTWDEFARAAPRVAGIFRRRHAACGNLCLLASTRADGSPRISPLEPRIFEGHLTLVGMPGTTKFHDLARDPRFCLHTATIDPHVSEGDAKLWGSAHHLADEALHDRFAQQLFADTGLDLRGRSFDPFLVADIGSASSVELVEGHLEITIWNPTDGERVVRRT
jgi:hypothetical protein